MNSWRKQEQRRQALDFLASIAVFFALGILAGVAWQAHTDGKFPTPISVERPQ